MHTALLMIVGERTLPFSDHDVVRKALSEIQ